MIAYYAIYTFSYYLLFKFLPLLQDPDYGYTFQILRHVVLLNISAQVSTFIWRQKFVPKSSVKPNKNAILITGCDTGFGNMLARRLDKVGFKIYACCLFENGQGAKELKSECSSKLSIIKLDVTSDEDVASAYKKIEDDLTESGYYLHAVVNNAGILSTGEIEFGPAIESCEKQIEVNCLGTMRVTKGFTPLLRRCKNLPRLVNITSMAARVALPGLVGYCVSKGAALAFTDGMRVELKKWNIQVISIEPHLFQTNLIAATAQRDHLTRLWQTSRDVTRQDLGDSYFDGAMKLLDFGLGTARSNVGDVVDTLVDACTIKYPETHYWICSSTWERIYSWMLINIIPKNIQDYLMHRVVLYLTGPPKGVH